MIRKVSFNNALYGIIDISYKNKRLPVVIDWNDVNKIKNLNSNWKCDKYGNIYCKQKINNIEKIIHMHDIVMGKKESKIIHINRLGLDNRKENLIFSSDNKSIYKNYKKKKRTINLPEDSGIDPNDIPTYIWYMKANKTHGERFYVNIGDIKWKTTSSRKFTLKHKLDLAKEYLKDLYKTRPELFESRSMNGDFNKQGKYLFDSFYDIIHRGGYKHIKKNDHKNNTKKLLEN